MEFKTCPVQFVTLDSWAWLDLFQHYRGGFLPLPGGILEQPVVFVDYMRLIESEFNNV